MMLNTHPFSWKQRRVKRQFLRFFADMQLIPLHLNRCTRRDFFAYGCHVFTDPENIDHEAGGAAESMERVLFKSI